MFSMVFFEDADIGHIHIFPSNEIPASDASDLPRLLDDTVVSAFGSLDVGQYIFFDSRQQSSLFLESEEQLGKFLTESETTVFLVVKDGALVHEWYAEGVDPEALHTSFSVSKSILSTTLGMAIEEGYISSLDDPVTDYVPELLERDPQFGAITLRDLVTMTSGLRYVKDRNFYGDAPNTYYSTDLRQSGIAKTHIVEPPGQNWLYNNYNPLLLGVVLERATGMTVSQYVSESWWGAMGAEADASWSTDSFYNRFEKLESGFNARPIDFARFGLMFANEGVVDGEQVVPRAWVEEATARTNVSLGDAAWLDQRYGYFWWVLPDGRFYAQGNLGQYVLVSPDDDVVIVRMGRDGRMSNGASLDWVSLLLEVTDRLSGSGPAGPEKAPGQKP